MQDGIVSGIKSNAGQIPPAQGASKRIARQRKTILRVVILVIVLIIAFAILSNPGTSPISSIRDTDGDGSVDCFDKAPLNSSVWNQAYAHIFVTVTNLNLNQNISFSLYLDGVGIAGGILVPQQSIISPLSIGWLYGKNSTKTCSIILLYTASNPSELDYNPIDSITVYIDANDSISVPSYY